MPDGARPTRANPERAPRASVADKRVDFSYEVRGGYSTLTRYADLSATDLVATSTSAYDDYARMTNLAHAQGMTSLAAHAYAFNADRLIDQHTTVDGTSDYTYDTAAQLTEAYHSFQADEDFSYDLTGNRTNTGYSTGAGNQLLSDGTYDYEYDNEGNRTKRTTIATDETVEYEWDHRNRLASVIFKDDMGNKTKQIDYVYDIDNRRIGKLLDSDGDGDIDDEWWFVYDPMTKPKLADIVLVFDANGDLRNRYLHGPDVDQILADENDTGDVLWPLADHLGTVRDVAEYNAGTDTTSVGNHITYDAFGQITNQSTPAHTPLHSFTGREWDADAELLYYRARWYDASVGRFLSEDPIGLDGADSNLWQYVLNTPTMLLDPSGLVSSLNQCFSSPAALAICIQEIGPGNLAKNFVNNGPKLIKYLQKLGAKICQGGKGSHTKLRFPDGRIEIVPQSPGLGTVIDILKRAAG